MKCAWGAGIFREGGFSSAQMNGNKQDVKN